MPRPRDGSCPMSQGLTGRVERQMWRLSQEEAGEPKGFGATRRRSLALPLTGCVVRSCVSMLLCRGVLIRKPGLALLE